MSEQKPRILILSLMKERFLDDTNSQLFDSMRKCAAVSPIIETVKEFKRQMSLFTPSVILVIDSAISKQKYALVLSQLVRYAKSGGRVICACNFSNHLAHDTAKEFFRTWGLLWDAGSYLRTTVYRNSQKIAAGISDISFTSLPPSYSIKSLYLINVRPNHCFYNPSESSYLESRVFPSDKFPIDPLETPCAFAPVGSGFFGYVGDVNAEETSTRAIMVMAQLPLEAVVPDARKGISAVVVTPGGGVEVAERSDANDEDALSAFTDTVRLAGQNVQTGFRMGKLSDGFMGPSTPGGKGPRKDASGKKSKPRSRETEVQIRAAKRAPILEQKLTKAEALKNEGNSLFKKGDSLRAIGQYKEAIATRGPHPLYLANLAAAYLKLEEYEKAEEACTEALIHDPKHIKARYRRGVALRQQHQVNRAIEDFEACVRLSPNDPHFRDEISQTKQLRATGTKSTPKSPYDIPHSLNPSLDDIPIPVNGADESESSDFEHEGNGKPCRAYNRAEGGCKSQKCDFQHAPPGNGIIEKKKNITTRDELGRNVCNYYLLDECVPGDAECPFTHSKQYLPENGWWKRVDGKDEASIDRFKTRMGM